MNQVHQMLSCCVIPVRSLVAERAGTVEMAAPCDA